MDKRRTSDIGMRDKLHARSHVCSRRRRRGGGRHHHHHHHHHTMGEDEVMLLLCSCMEGKTPGDVSAVCRVTCVECVPATSWWGVLKILVKT